MIIGLMIIFFILIFVFLFIGVSTYEHEGMFFGMSVLSGIIAIVIMFLGFFHGFINYPKTEGTHQGILTAVDLEGVYFRRYEVYLKSGEYTGQSDETVYKIYDYETELAEQLQNAVGKKVKIYYGHDGGYIPWNSCGTYHIKKIEIVED